MNTTMYRSVLASVFLITSSCSIAQCDGWQQKVEYDLFIDLDVKDHSFIGTERIKYYNNSPDTIYRVFYHLYFNAFKPGSMMDVRSRTIKDPDKRISEKIHQLSPEEMGDLTVTELKQSGKALDIRHVGTILEVELAKVLLPGKSTLLEMKFEGQVPVQVRRSGRDNKEGIAYSMSQWYPKLCEFDEEGWHANPYIAREFHGVWGDFDLKISIDRNYTVASTGYLQNPQEIGHGYEQEGEKLNVPDGEKLTWHFSAPNVHDVAWAADPDYRHDITRMDDGTEFHFFYKNDSALFDAWQDAPPYMVQCFEYLNKTFGQYPYKKYSFVQGGDGGMEYPMMTLVTGKRSLKSLVGVSTHEAIHSWFQGVLASNESLYPWVDEGFTSYATSQTFAQLFPDHTSDPHGGARRGYLMIVESGEEEPLSTHADHYNSNMAYGIASYSKGELFLDQLSYVIGMDAFNDGMLQYFERCKFKHPSPRDLKRIMEKRSGLELDWYFEQWIFTTNTIDYSVQAVEQIGDSVFITLEKKGLMMMPIDLVITGKDGNAETHYIPLRIMRGSKKAEDPNGMTIHDNWPWTHPTYTLALAVSVEDLQRIEIDPSYRMVDIDRENNVLDLEDGLRFKIQR